MGHDIRAHKIVSHFAEINRGAFNDLNIEIYKALDAERFYAGVSGNGDCGIFYKEQLEDALEVISKNEHLWQEKQFLESCLENLDECERVVIDFS